MHDALAKLSATARKTLQEKEQPDWTKPMLATLVHDTFSDPEWIYERKLDGERCLAFVKDGEVTLYSRNRKELNVSYPEIEAAFEEKNLPDLIADGEIVAFDGQRTSFSRLQGRMQVKDREEAHQSGIAVFYYLFDLLHFAGYQLTGLSLRERKKVLQRALGFADPLRYLNHVNKTGEAYHREACEKGWEGVIAKDASAKYVHSRSKKWLKFKCTRGQEFVIVGYTDPAGSRVEFGALLLGYHDEDGQLRYAGKVGTGFDDDFLKSFGKTLKSLERKTSPIDCGDVPDTDGVHWVRPEQVGEVGFTEWTEDNKLRHPRFLGLRRDKQAAEVVREEPA